MIVSNPASFYAHSYGISGKAILPKERYCIRHSGGRVFLAVRRMSDSVDCIQSKLPERLGVHHEQPCKPYI